MQYHGIKQSTAFLIVWMACVSVETSAQSPNTLNEPLFPAPPEVLPAPTANATAVPDYTDPLANGTPSNVPTEFPAPPIAVDLHSPSAAAVSSSPVPASGPTYFGVPCQTACPMPSAVPWATPCAMPCSPPCDPCPPLGNICGASCCCPRWWARAELLAWFIEGADYEPLVTSSAAGSPASIAGVLGAPDTTVLFDRKTLDDNGRLGGRITAGWWFDDCRKCGFQAEFWGLDGPDDDYYLASDGDPIIARPFFNTDIGAFDSQIIAFPGLARGSIDIDTDGQMYSAAPLWRFNAKCCNKCCRGRTVINRFDFLAGYRYWHFGEDLRITEQLEPTNPLYAPGTTFTLTDIVRTRNDFHGGEFGIEWLQQRGTWFLEMNARVAIGQMFRRIDGTGSTHVVLPGALNQTIDGGFYVPAGGIRIRDNQFTAIPQARIAFGCYVLPCLRLHFGYDFMYASNTVRPDGALDSGFPGSRLARGTPDQISGFKDTDIWVQGLSVGAALNF